MKLTFRPCHRCFVQTELHATNIITNETDKESCAINTVFEREKSLDSKLVVDTVEEVSQIMRICV